MVTTIGQALARALGLLFVLSSVSGAQESGTRARTTIVGATLSGFIGPYPGENIGAFGGLVGLEQKLSDGIFIRALASVQRGVSSDNVNVCKPDAMDGCLVILLPYWLSSVEVNAAFKPHPGLPLRVVVGLGYAIGFDARETRSRGHNASLPAETGLVMRRGLEIPLGRSPRAPRLQFTRSSFRPDPFSLKRVEALTLLIVR